VDIIGHTVDLKNSYELFLTYGGFIYGYEISSKKKVSFNKKVWLKKVSFKKVYV